MKRFRSTQVTASSVIVASWLDFRLKRKCDYNTEIPVFNIACVPGGIVGARKKESGGGLISISRSSLLAGFKSTILGCKNYTIADLSFESKQTSS